MLVEVVGGMVGKVELRVEVEEVVVDTMEEGEGISRGARIGGGRWIGRTSL